MSSILSTPTPTTQQQRIFSPSNFWHRQANERQQLVNDHLEELKAKMPANATHRARTGNSCSTGHVHRSVKRRRRPILLRMGSLDGDL